LSLNRGGQLRRQSFHSSRDRPTLERPSLFAGMEDDSSPLHEGDTQRVRILSTLESARRTSSGRKSRRLPEIQGITRRRRQPWQTRVLIALMGLGVLALLASFIMVILDGHGETAQRHQETGKTPDASTRPALPSGTARATPVGRAPGPQADNPLAALMPTPPRTQTPAPTQTAVIETVAPAMPAPRAAPPVIERSAEPQAPAPKTTIAAAPSAATVPAAARDKSGLDMVKAIASRQDTSAAKRPASQGKAHDEDVALLEAMFAHTRPRPAETVSVSEQLRQHCGALSGAEAATCRARICVQNPTAAACHQD
jgi:hypothetical protein